ncbi:rhodanese-like domain-containing protein [Roseivivax sp. CAU 1761]
MPMSVKDLVAEAKANITSVTPEEAQKAQASGDLILDVREPGELDSDGRIDGALHVPRGVLEAKADPDSGATEARLAGIGDKARVHVLCASGARAAMAAHTLTRMGYRASVIEGGLKGWTEAGLPVS